MSIRVNIFFLNQNLAGLFLLDFLPHFPALLFGVHPALPHSHHPLSPSVHCRHTCTHTCTQCSHTCVVTSCTHIQAHGHSHMHAHAHTHTLTDVRTEMGYGRCPELIANGGLRNQVFMKQVSYQGRRTNTLDAAAGLCRTELRKVVQGEVAPEDQAPAGHSAGHSAALHRRGLPLPLGGPLHWDLEEQTPESNPDSARAMWS